MFPKNTTTVAIPEKPPLPEQKDSAVVYMVDGGQVDADSNIWQIKRAKICACTVVITTVILVVGTLGAIAIILRSQQGTSEATPFFNAEGYISHNSPLEEPIYDPPIKIDDGGLWLPQNPGTPDLVAVDGQGTVALASSPKPDTDGIDLDSEGNPIIQPAVVQSSESEPSSSSDRDYNGRTYISSSFPYGGFYMRGDSGEPPPSHSEDSSADPSEGSGDMNSLLEGSAEPEATDDIDIDPEGNPTVQPTVVPSSESESSPSDFDYYGRTYISSSFPYGGFYMRGDSGEPPPSHSEDSSADLSEGSGDMDSDLEGSAEPEAMISSDSGHSSSEQASSSSFSDPYVVSERR